VKRWSGPLIAVLATLLGFQGFLRSPASCGEVEWRNDLAEAFLPLRLHAERLGTYREPEVFLGTPFAGNPQAGAFYPLHLPFLVIDPGPWYGLLLPLHAALGALGAYLLARALRRSRVAATAAGTGYGLSAAFVLQAWAGHVPGLFQAGIAPWVFLALVRGNGLGLGLAGGLAALAGHWNETAYLALGALLAGLATPRGRRTLLVATPVALAIGGPQLLSTAPFIAECRRSRLRYEQTLQGEMRPDQLLDLVVPFAHGPPGPAFFGSLSFHESSHFSGAVLVALGVLGALRGGRRARLIAVLGALALVHALGEWGVVHRALFFVPGFSLLRGPTRTLFLFSLALALLAAFGVDASRSERDIPFAPRGGWARDLLPLLGLVVALLVGLAPRAAVLPAGPQALDRARAALGNASLSFGSLALLSTAIVSLRRRGARIPLLVAACGELLIFATALLAPAERLPEDVARTIAARGHGRFWDTTNRIDMRQIMAFSLESVGGMDPISPRAHDRFAQELLGDERELGPLWMWSPFTTSPPDAPRRVERSALDLMRVRWVVLPANEPAPADFAAVASLGPVVIHENTHSLHEAWALRGDAARAATTARAPELARLVATQGTAALATWTSADRLEIAAAGPALYLVPTTFSRSFVAREGGEPVETLSLAGLLGVRARGGSAIEVVFAPAGTTLAPVLTGSALVGALLALALRRRARARARRS
jgi:hypothetical protein